MIAMGGLVFDFAVSSNSYVDSLNNVCSGINMDLSREPSAKENCLCMWFYIHLKRPDPASRKKTKIYLKKQKYFSCCER